ncbi:uncharacterized protein DS421_9g263610 [Arachis hypogaea]|nr:uncharacterized protein DS421_9g263610 [Arachis hypogaea]
MMMKNKVTNLCRFCLFNNVTQVSFPLINFRQLVLFSKIFNSAYRETLLRV